MAQFNVTMPATNSSDPVVLRRYIGKLVEELRYTISNLDDSNISRAGIQPDENSRGGRGAGQDHPGGDRKR